MVEMSRKYLPLYQRLASGNKRDAANGHELPAQNQDTKSTACPIIPSIAIDPWRSSDIPKQLPPLPQIKDTELERQTFSHPGVGRGPNYERLEWLGDAFLEVVATAIISATFTTMPSGRCSQIREQLIRNITLAGYFREYGLTSKAQLPPEVFQNSGKEGGKSADKDLVKTQADMFEAYVAAVILSDPENGVTNCVNWLKALWARTIKGQIIQAERDIPPKQLQNPSSTTPTRTSNPKEQLAQLIVVKGVKIQYKDMPGKERRDKNLNLELFTVGVYLTGWGENDRLLGWGSGLSKKEAGQKAAARALESKKQMKIYAAKKQAFLEAQNVAEGGDENKTES